MSRPRITFPFAHAFGKARKPVSLFLVLCSSSISASHNCNAVARQFWFVWLIFPQETWSNRILSVQGFKSRQQGSLCPNTRNDWRITSARCGLATELKTAWGMPITCSEAAQNFGGLVLFIWLLLKKLSFRWYFKGMCCDLSLARFVWCEIWVWPWKNTLQECVYFALCWR